MLCWRAGLCIRYSIALEAPASLQLPSQGLYFQSISKHKTESNRSIITASNMIGDPEFVILKYQSWLDATSFEDRILGSIVKEFLRPTNNYVPDTPLKHNNHDFVEGAFNDFVLDKLGSKSNEAIVNLKSIAGISFRGNTEDSVQLAGKRITYKRLQQHDQFWTKLRADPDVRATVPGWISRFSTWPVCLVVGIMICEDVELSFEGERSIKREGKTELPISKITLTASTPNPAGDTGDPQVSFMANRQTITVFKAKVEERRIFALELRKITTKGWVNKELTLRNEGPEVDETRLAAGESDEEDDDRLENIEDLVLAEFSNEEYEDMAS